MGIGIAGALEGLSGAMQREHEENLARDMAGRQAAMGGWTRILDDPNVTPEHKKYALSAIMGIATTPSGKNWSKFTKPYEPPAPQPQQAQQQTPGMVLRPQPPANPGPQAPIAAGGGASPGVLQGQANQLPPMQPMAPPPPPVPSAVGMGAQSGIPMAPATVPGSTTTVTGPPPPPDAYAAAGYFRPGVVQAQAMQAEQEAQLMARAKVYEQIRQQGKAQGMSDEDAAMRASMLTGIMPRAGMSTLHPIKGEFSGTQAASMGATMPDGSPITPDDAAHYNLGRDAFNRLIASPIATSTQGLTKGWKKDAQSSTGFAMQLYDKYGKPVGDVIRDIMPPTGLVPKLHSSASTMDENGNIITTSETRPDLGAGASGHTPPPPPGAAASKPKSNTNGSISAAGSATGGEGRLGFQTNVALRKDAIQAAAKMRPMVDLLDSAESYYKAAKFDSAGDLGLIINAVRSMNPGTVRLPNKELEMEVARGTYGERAQRWYKARLDDGTLPPKFRDELMGVIRRETTMAARDAAANWQQVMPNRPLPAHLKRFGGADNTPPPPDGSKGGPVVVDGFSFPNQAAADAYKKEVGAH